MESRSRLELDEWHLRRRRDAKWSTYPTDVIPAWQASMDFRVADPVAEVVERTSRWSDFGYPLRVGCDTVEEAFAHRMLSRFGWEIHSPGTVTVVTDLIQAITALLVVFSDEGDGVVVQAPIWPPVLSIISEGSRVARYSRFVESSDQWTIDFESLSEAAAEARMMFVCNPHNPLGRVLRRDELLAIARVAIDHDLTIVADEIHCDFTYSGHRHTPLASLGEEVAQRTITVNSASKGFNLAGLFCGVMHFGSHQLKERFEQTIPPRLMGRVSGISIDATVAAWRHAQSWQDEVLLMLDHNRSTIRDWVSEVVPELGYLPPEGTYLAWFDCERLALPGDPADFFMERAKVGLSPGRPHGGGADSFVRLNFGTSPTVLHEILSRITDAVATLR